MKGIAQAFPPIKAEACPVVVLGIDQSSSCGWAVLGSDMRKPVYGVLKLPAGDDETPGLLAIHKLISEAIAEHGVTACFFEQPYVAPHMHVPSIGRQFMYIAAIMLAAGLHELTARQVPIQSWRKQFTGRGKAPPGLRTSDAKRRFWKAEAIKCCADRGWYVDQHDAAEAIGIASFGLCCLSKDYAAKDAPIFRRAEMRQEVWT